MAIVERFDREYYVVRWRNNDDILVEREFKKLIPAIEYGATVRHGKDIKIVNVGGRGKFTAVSINKVVEYTLRED